jgi:hypothetical protein
MQWPETEEEGNNNANNKMTIISEMTDFILLKQPHSLRSV